MLLEVLNEEYGSDSGRKYRESSWSGKGVGSVPVQESERPVILPAEVEIPFDIRAVVLEEYAVICE